MFRSSKSNLPAATQASDIRSRIFSWLVRFNAYLICFGATRGVVLFFLTRVPASRLRQTTVVPPGSAEPVLLRHQSSDVQVYNDIYVRQEYGWELPVTPKVIVDAGAYTGLSTAFFASRFPDAKIIAIEPDEDNFELLAQNTSHFANVHIIRAALWYESGSVSLMDPGDGAWGLRLLESDVNAGEATSAVRSDSVRAITIADVIRDYDLEKIDLLKVDVEGSEKEIFAAANSWISYVDAICIELHDRFKTGCSRSFYKAVEDFPVEVRRGEDVLVIRERSSRGSPVDSVSR
jgi:FkbM family methyltransferase